MPDIFGRETPQERMERERLEAAQREAEARKEEAKVRGAIQREAAKRASLPGTTHGAMHGGAMNYAQGAMNNYAAHLDAQNDMIGATLRSNARRVAEGRDRMAALETRRMAEQAETDRLLAKLAAEERMAEKQMQMQRERLMAEGKLKAIRGVNSNGFFTRYVPR